MIHLLFWQIIRKFTFLIPCSRARKALRKAWDKKIEFAKLECQAKFSVKKGNELALARPAAAKIHVHGKDNKIIFREANGEPLPLEISITGDGNTIDIGENVHIDKFVSLHITANGTFFRIGSNTTLNGVDFRMNENNSHTIIGSNCIFSWGVDVWCTDGHSIIDPQTNALTNKGKFIEIGDRVWVGKDVKIGKNVKIASGCIVGWGSIVTKSFEEENCIIAGVPATIVKRGRTWNIAMPEDYDKRLK